MARLTNPKPANPTSPPTSRPCQHASRCRRLPALQDTGAVAGASAAALQGDSKGVSDSCCCQAAAPHPSKRA